MNRITAILYLLAVGTFTVLSFVFVKATVTSTILTVVFIVNVILLIDVIKGKK